jgi:hypothetical protein
VLPGDGSVFAEDVADPLVLAYQVAALLKNDWVGGGGILEGVDPPLISGFVGFGGFVELEAHSFLGVVVLQQNPRWLEVGLFFLFYQCLVGIPFDSLFLIGFALHFRRWALPAEGLWLLLIVNGVLLL